MEKYSRLRKDCKYAMLIGSYGSGKSSLINALFELQGKEQRIMGNDHTDTVITFIGHPDNTNGFLPKSDGFERQPVRNQLLERAFVLDTPGSGDVRLEESVVVRSFAAADQIVYVFSFKHMLRNENILHLHRMANDFHHTAKCFVFTHLDAVRKDTDQPVQEDNIDYKERDRLVKVISDELEELGIFLDLSSAPRFYLYTERGKPGFGVAELRSFLFNDTFDLGRAHELKRRDVLNIGKRLTTVFLDRAAALAGYHEAVLKVAERNAAAFATIVDLEYDKIVERATHWRETLLTHSDDVERETSKRDRDWLAASATMSNEDPAGLPRALSEHARACGDFVATSVSLQGSVDSMPGELSDPATTQAILTCCRRTEEEANAQLGNVTATWLSQINALKASCEQEAREEYAHNNKSRWRYLPFWITGWVIVAVGALGYALLTSGFKSPLTGEGLFQLLTLVAPLVLAVLPFLIEAVYLRFRTYSQIAARKFDEKKLTLIRDMERSPIVPPSNLKEVATEECEAWLRTFASRDRDLYVKQTREIELSLQAAASRIADKIRSYLTAWRGLRDAVQTWYSPEEHSYEGIRREANTLRELCIQPAMDAIRGGLTRLQEFQLAMKSNSTK